MNIFSLFKDLNSSRVKMSLLTKIYEFGPNWVRTVMLNGYALKIHRQRFGSVFRKASKELLRTERMSLENLQEYQSEVLRKLVQHSYRTVPYYRELFDLHGIAPTEIKDVRDLRKIPLLRKDDVRNNKLKLVSSDYKLKDLYPGHTSGTTGSPLQFYWDLNTCIYNNAVDWRQKNWAGINYGDPIAMLLGRMIIPTSVTKPPYWQKNYLHNQLWMSSFHLSEETFPAYLGELKRFKPLAIEAYPFTAYIVAKLLLKNGIKFPLKAVFTSSETLLPLQREAIEEAFDCKVFNFLGMAERVVFATECMAHDGFHLNSDFAINEIIDSEGNAVPDGQSGYVVGTSLTNFGMPFIRYLTSDVSAIKKEPCNCGRSFPRLVPVTTKDEDLIVTPEGRIIAPVALTHPFKPLKTIIESQIIQESVDELVVRVVKGPNYLSSEGDQLISGLRERLGDQIGIRIEFVDKIERTSAGKYRWVISKVKSPL